MDLNHSVALNKLIHIKPETHLMVQNTPINRDWFAFYAKFPRRRSIIQILQCMRISQTQDETFPEILPLEWGYFATSSVCNFASPLKVGLIKFVDGLVSFLSNSASHFKGLIFFIESYEIV